MADSILITIWDDIDHNAELIAIEDFTYPISLLSNQLYLTLDRPIRSKKRRLYRDLNAIRTHAEKLSQHPIITNLIQELFGSTAVISNLDRVFLNAYYRRLLRAKLELTLKGRELPAGLIITGYPNHTIDAAIVGTLRLLRLVCRYLGIPDTVTAAKFSQEKLYMPSLWRDISAKFIQYFGEDQIDPIEVDAEMLSGAQFGDKVPWPSTSVSSRQMQDGVKRVRQTQVLQLLNIVFKIWSGSILLLTKDSVEVIPAIYITRMLPLMQDLSFDRL